MSQPTTAAVPVPAALPIPNPAPPRSSKRSTSASWCSTAPPAPRSRASTSPPRTSAARSSKAATRISASPAPTSSDGLSRVLSRRRLPTSSRPTPSAGTPLVLAEYGLCRSGVRDQPARRAARARGLRASSTRPGGCASSAARWVRRRKAISVTGGITFEELIENFRVQALGLMAGGADYLLVETCQDTRNIKAGADRHRARVRRRPAGDAGGGLGDHRGDRHDARRPGRRGARGLAAARRPALRRPQLRHRPGAHDRPPAHPLRALPHPRRLRAQRRPAGRGRAVPEGPEVFRARLRPLPRRRLAQPRRRLLRHHRRRTSRRSPSWSQGQRAAADPAPSAAAWSPGIEAVELDDDNRPLLVGERTNVLGSRKFKGLIARRGVRGRRRGGPRAGARAAPRCSTSACRTPTATSSADIERLPRPAGAHGQGAADDRLDRRAGDGARAHLVPGQGDAQLDQPGGRPRAASSKVVPLAPALRRRPRRRPDRREPGWRSPSSASSRWRAAATRS